MLENLNFGKLTHLESGQHVKSVHDNLSGSAQITDPVLLQYLVAVKAAADRFDSSQVQHAKSDETQKIDDADLERDYAFSTLRRAVEVFEFSKSQPHKLAYTSLVNMLADYSGLQDWNYIQASNGIDNLIADLETPKYAQHVLLLGLGVHVDRLQSGNDDFKSLFSGRTQEQAQKPGYDTKNLRQEMYTVYDNMADYIVAMAKVPNANVQYSQALGLVNANRKYYSDMIAKREGITKAKKQ